MAVVSGKLLVDNEVGVIGIEVPERATAGLLRDPGFISAGREAWQGNVVGLWHGVPVAIRRRKPA